MTIKEALTYIGAFLENGEAWEERKVRKLFPKEKNHFWYCGEWNDYQDELRKQRLPWKSKDIKYPCDTFLVNPFVNYQEIREGAMLPCIQVDGWVGHYLITRKWRPFGSDDFLPWDDGYSLNMVLHHCERAPEESIPEEKVGECTSFWYLPKLERRYGKTQFFCVGVTPGDYCPSSSRTCPFARHKGTYTRMKNRSLIRED